MALTNELAELKRKLVAKGYSGRTAKQDRVLAELEALDRVLMQKSLESVFASETRMTSPDDGRCGCCGK
jgi:hypothetical protein